MSIKEAGPKTNTATRPSSPSQCTQSKETSKSDNSDVRGGKGKPEVSDAVEVSSEANSSESRDGDLTGLLSGISDWASEDSTSPETRLQLGQGELLSRGRGNAEKVTRLQEMLNADGGQLEVDGVFGPRTAEAVRNYQREHGLKVDGVVGPETMASLNGGETPRSPDQARLPGETSRPNQSGGATAVSRPDESAPVETPSAPQGAADSSTRLQGIPERPEDARGGREFMDSISNLPPGPQRDQAVLNEILSGNIPENSRNMQDIVVNRNGREIRMSVMPDYLAIGSDEDNVRIPMTPDVAQAIADRTGTSLPTDRMVDDIHAQSRRLYMPTFSNNREGVPTYVAQDQRIDEQLGSGRAPTELVSGHKKDLVIPHRNGRVAIYGGRWQNGGLIQGYSNVHHDGYEDYSHGARLVSQQITIDGQSMLLRDALADPSLRSLFTNQSGAFSY